MRTKIISIGNSRGIRIPKVLLEETGLDKEIELTLRKNRLEIRPIRMSIESAGEPTLLSETALIKDWSRAEEDRAWSNL